MKQLFLLLLTTLSLSAQIKGVVLDSISGKPIPYVGVFSSKPEFNFSTDKKGKFKADNFTKQDTLWFFTTGYEEKKITVEDLSKKILLKPILNNQEKENIDMYNQKKQWIDFQTNNTSSFKTTSSSSTILKAYFIEGINSSNKNIILDKLSFKAVNLTQKENIFKIRFFKADSLKKVGEEILTESIIVKMETSEKREPNTIYHFYALKEIDFLDKEIQIPEEGFFIALESINIKQNQYNVFFNETNNILISPSINATNVVANVYSYIKGKWKKIEKANYFPDFKISIATTKN
jgi:hypothetical protein